MIRDVAEKMVHWLSVPTQLMVWLLQGRPIQRNVNYTKHGYVIYRGNVAMGYNPNLEAN